MRSDRDRVFVFVCVCVFSGTNLVRDRTSVKVVKELAKTFMSKLVLTKVKDRGFENQGRKENKHRVTTLIHETSVLDSPKLLTQTADTRHTEAGSKTLRHPEPKEKIFCATSTVNLYDCSQTRYYLRGYVPLTAIGVVVLTGVRSPSVRSSVLRGGWGHSSGGTSSLLDPTPRRNGPVRQVWVESLEEEDMGGGGGEGTTEDVGNVGEEYHENPVVYHTWE